MEIPEPAQGLHVRFSAPGNDNTELAAQSLSSSILCPLFTGAESVHPEEFLMFERFSSSTPPTPPQPY